MMSANKGVEHKMNHKVLDERAAPVVHSAADMQDEDIELSPAKAKLMETLRPKESDRAHVTRLNMETERLAPLPDLDLIPDVAPELIGGDDTDDELVRALQEMAGSSVSDGAQVPDISFEDEFDAPGQAMVLPDDELALSDEKQALLDSLLPSSDDVRVMPMSDLDDFSVEQEGLESLSDVSGLDTTGMSAKVPLDIDLGDDDEPIFGNISIPEPVPELPQLDKVFTDDFLAGGDLEVSGAGGVSLADLPDREIFVPPLKEVASEQLAGLSMWDDCATVCLMSVKKGKLVVTHAGYVEFPEKAGDAERVYLLKRLWKKSAMPTRSVWLSVHASSLLQKYVQYDLKDDALKAALLRDAEQSLQGLGGDVAVDWSLAPRAQGGVQGMLFAIPAWERDHYLGLMQKAGLCVCGMSAPACDIARALDMARPYPDLKIRPAECVVSFSPSGADIVIMYGSGCFFSRTVYSRVASWRDNMNYLYECLNDAMGYFSTWISEQPVTALLLTGIVPDVPDLGGELLRETGIFAEIWNPVQESPSLTLAQSAKRSGVSGTMLAGAAGLAIVRD